MFTFQSVFSRKFKIFKNIRGHIFWKNKTRHEKKTNALCRTFHNRINFIVAPLKCQKLKMFMNFCVNFCNKNFHLLLWDDPFVFVLFVPLPGLLKQLFQSFFNATTKKQPFLAIQFKTGKETFLSQQSPELTLFQFLAGFSLLGF